MVPLNKLETKYIRLREVEPEDLELIYEWENDMSLWKYSNTLKPFSKYQIKEYIKNSSLDLTQTKQLRLMIVLNKDNITIGTIDLYDIDFFNKRAGVGILIKDSKYKKQGYASQALLLLINYSKQILNLKQLYCEILIDNIESINLFKSKDFIITGEKKNWIKINNNWINQFFLQKAL